MTYAHTLEHGIKEPIAIYLLQIAFILAMCRLCGFLVSFLKQPPVVGEIIAGILMGPSVMGQSESFRQFMFPKSSLPLLKGTASLGITLFMFILGLEFKPDAMMSSIRRTWFIGLSGIALPFIIGFTISAWLYDVTDMIHAQPPVSHSSYKLFMGCCISFTAFPVLARILASNNAMTTQIGLVSMAVASLDDVLAWTVLAVATSIQVGGDPINALYALLITAAWILFLVFVVSPCLIWLETKNISATNYVFFVFCGMCITAWLTEILGLHAFFGAFVFGICLPKGEETHNFIKQLEVLVVNFFVPLFFASSGLTADLTTLSGLGGGPVIAIIVLASAGKMLPCLLLGRCKGYSWRFAFQLASLMNARGLIALIALNIAISVHVFNVQTYSILLIMALVTTFMAGPMFYLSYDPKIDPPFSVSTEGHDKHKDDHEEDEQKSGSCGPCTDVPVDLQLKDEEKPYYAGYMFHRDLAPAAPAEEQEVAQEPVEVPFFYPVVRVQSNKSLNPVVKTEGSPKKARDPVVKTEGSPKNGSPKNASPENASFENASPEQARSQSSTFHSKKPERPEPETGTSNHAKVHFHTSSLDVPERTADGHGGVHFHSSSSNGLDGPGRTPLDGPRTALDGHGGVHFHTSSPGHTPLDGPRTALDGHGGVHFHTSSSNGLDVPGHTPLDDPVHTPLDGQESNQVVRGASARMLQEVPQQRQEVRATQVALGVRTSNGPVLSE